jgi:hypothetical protein
MSILWVLGRPAYGISSSRYNTMESVLIRYLNISIWWSLWSCMNYQLCCTVPMILITCYLNWWQADNRKLFFTWNQNFPYLHKKWNGSAHLLYL